MVEENNKKFAKMTDFYKDPEKFRVITELQLTPVENFELKDLDDLEQYRSYFNLLTKLNVSNNLLSKLSLRNFLNLTHVSAPTNMITEVALSLNRLTELNLRGNLISKMINVSNLLSIRMINLDQNLIETISIHELIPIKSTLRELFLSYNKLQFSAYEFIAFIDGLKVFQMENLNLEGNKFIYDNKSLTHNYKIFIVASIRTLLKLNGENINLSREVINLKEVTVNIINQEKEIKNDELNKKVKEKSNTTPDANKIDLIISEGRDIKKGIERRSKNKKTTSEYDVIDLKDFKGKFKIINEIFDNLNMTSELDQTYFMELMKAINKCLEFPYINTPNPFDPEIKEDFSIFLINCHMLIELNPNVEIAIYKAIAQFSIFQRGDFFVEECFYFFKTLILSSTFRAHDIIKVLESVVFTQIATSDRDPPFKIIDSIVQFYKDIQLDVNFKFYRDFIPIIINYLKNFDSSTLFSFDDPSKQCKYEYMQNYKTCILFINEYLKIDMKSDNSDVKSDDEDIKQEHYVEDYEYDYQKGFQVMQGNDSDFITQNTNDSNVSKNSGELFFKEYGFSKNSFEDNSDIFLVEESDTESDDNRNDDYDYKDKDNNKEVKKSDKTNINKIDKTKTHINLIDKTKNNITKKTEINDNMCKILNKKIHECKPVEKYFQIFYCSFNLSEKIISYLPKIFKCSENILQLKVFYLGVKLLNTILNKLNDTCESLEISVIDKQYDEIIKIIQNSTAIKVMCEFIKDFLSSYTSDPSQFDNSIQTSYPKISLLEEEENSNKFYKFKKYIVKIFEGYGYLCKFCTEKKFKEQLNTNVPYNLFQVVTLLTVDPMILLGACYFIKNTLDNPDIQNDQMTLSRIMSKVSNFSNMIRYINSKDQCYKQLYTKVAENYENLKNYDVNSIEKLDSKLMGRLFISIIDIFKMLSDLSRRKGPIGIIINSTISILTDNKLHEHLGNCLKIDDDDVRKISVECLYNYNHDLIKKEIIDQIIAIISAYDSVTKGETEEILSIIFAILSDIILINIKKKDNKDKKFSFIEAIKMSFIFLSKNSDRSPEFEEEISEKNCLCASLLLFLNISSMLPEFSYLTNKADIEQEFQNILYYDYKYFNPNHYIPIEIERSKLGDYMGILIETTSSERALPPYCYPFLRIIIKMSDVLCKIQDFTYSVDYSLNFNDFSEILIKQIKLRENHRFLNEKHDWYNFNHDISSLIMTNTDSEKIIKEIFNMKQFITRVDNKKNSFMIGNFVIDYIEEKKKLSCLRDNKLRRAKGEDIDYIYENQYNIKNSVSVTKITENTHYENENSEVEEENDKFSYIPKLSKEDFIKEQLNFVAYFPNFLMYILGQTSNLQESNTFQTLTVKFDPRIYNPENILKSYEENKSLNTKIQPINDSKPINSSLLINVREDIKQFSNNRSLDSKDSSSLEMYMMITNKNNLKDLYKLDQIRYYNKFENDLLSYDEYGTDLNKKRNLNEETPNNPHIRSILISALLRCIYAVLVSPSTEVRNNMLEILLIDDKLQNILMLADTGLMFEHNIAHKTLIMFGRIFDKENNNILLKSFSEKSNKIKKQDDSSNSNNDVEINEKRLFGFYYVFGLYLEKVLYYYYQRYFLLENYEFVFLKDLVLTFHAFIRKTVLEYTFKKVSLKFFEDYIFKLILKEEYIDIFFKCLNIIEFMKDKTQIELENFYLECSLQAVEQIFYVESNFKDKEVLKLNIIRYFMEYYNYLDKIEDSIYEIFVIMIHYYSPCKNYILSKFVNQFRFEESNAKKNYYNNLKKEMLVNPKKGVWSSKEFEKEEIKSYPKIYLNTDMKHKMLLKLINCQKLINNSCYLKDLLITNTVEEYTLFFEICEYTNIPTKVNCLACCLLTNKQFYVFEIKLEDYEQMSNCFINMDNINKPLLKVNFDEILEIYEYDYKNRILLKTKEKMISLLFNTIIKVTKLIYYVKHSNSNTIIAKYSSLTQIIKDREEELPHVKDKIKERNGLSEKSTRSKNETSIKELENLLKKYKKLFVIKNNIQLQFVNKSFEFDTNIFLISHRNTNFFSSLFEKEDGTMIRDKKIVFLSEYHLILLKENLSKMDLIPSNDKIWGDTLIVDGSKVFDIITIIKFENIIKFQKDGDMCCKITFYDDDPKNLNDMNFQFSGSLEFFLFKNKLNLLIRKAIDEIYFKVVLKNSKNKKQKK